jgi:hypothetical protein
MSKGFYAAWAAVVLTALVVPVAVPFAVWPPAYFDDAQGSGDCASIAKDYAAEHPATKLWPVSVDVERCTGTLSDPDMPFEARVEARGPYGIPFASGSVTRTDIRHFDGHGGVYLGLAALLGGVAAASLPFAGVLLRHRIVRRVAFAA